MVSDPAVYTGDLTDAQEGQIRRLHQTHDPQGRATAFLILSAPYGGPKGKFSYRTARAS